MRDRYFLVILYSSNRIQSSSYASSVGLYEAWELRKMPQRWWATLFWP